jgi:hypothetical protein
MAFQIRFTRQYQRASGRQADKRQMKRKPNRILAKINKHTDK